MSRPKLPLLVTGCGRGGTHYTAMLLRVAGLDVGHECDRRDGRVDWYAASWLPTMFDSYGTIWHVTRHPLRQIESMHLADPETWEFLTEQGIVDSQDPLLLKCMKYWYHWNLLAGLYAREQFRVEDAIQQLPVFGLLEDPYVYALAQGLPQETRPNRRDGFQAGLYPSISVKQLATTDRELHDDILRLATKYGYESL